MRGTHGLKIGGNNLKFVDILFNRKRFKINREIINFLTVELSI